jgi:23S rRNA (pseudouridine1915-N3)-methyltransferase
MNIKIICLGKIREKSLSNLIDEYKKRISKYSNIEIIELSDESIPETCSQKESDNIKKVECEKISKYIKPTDYVISLDLTGKQLTSEELSEKIQDITLNRF